MELRISGGDAQGRLVLFGFHPEFAYENEHGEKDSAEKEDSAHAGVLREDTTEQEPGDLRGEDEGHDG